MLLNEIATVTNISDAAEKRYSKKKEAEPKSRRKTKPLDPLAQKRVETHGIASQFRAVATQFNPPK